MKITDTFTRTYTAQGEAVTLTYSVFLREGDGQYGITVLTKIEDDIETETVSSITNDYNYALYIARALCGGLVPPVSVRDIVYDFLCSKYTI